MVASHSPEQPPPDESFIAYTLNVNGLGTDYYSKLRWIRLNLINKRKADIILIQEHRFSDLQGLQSAFFGFLGKGKLLGFSPAVVSDVGGKQGGVVTWVPETSKVLDRCHHVWADSIGRTSMVRVDFGPKCYHLVNLYAPWTSL